MSVTVARAPMTAVTFASDDETIHADLYGTLPAARAAILVHGAGWDASGWQEVGRRFPERGVPALAVNLRGFGKSTGKTNRWSNKRWSALTDLHAAKSFLRERGAREIALVGSSMGGHAVLASSFENDVESVVAVSAPVTAVEEELAKRITGRKLFVCANKDQLGATPNVLQCFTDASAPKTLIFYGGREHSRAMFRASYAEEAISAILEFVCPRA